MIYSIFSQKDVTIYESNEYLNTGVDSILELIKDVDIYVTNTRILTKFDLSDIPNEATASSHIYYLNLITSNTEEIPSSYTLYAHPISQSWEMGTGKSDYYPIVKEGVSWKFRDGYTPQTYWFHTESIASGSTYHYISESGGGTWYTSSQATQSYSYQTSDLRMDVTDIVDDWNNSIIPNEGFIIKRSNNDETSSVELGSIKFYSRDSHTIFPPRLEICWDDSNFTTGSLNPLISGSIYIDDIVLYLKNIRPRYKRNSKIRLRIVGRERYPSRTYSTTSAYLTVKYLPSSSYYSIRDMASSEVVVPFDTNYTKVSCDVNGNYIDLWLNGFQDERYYELLFKVVDTSGNEEYFQNDYYFKVER